MNHLRLLLVSPAIGLLACALFAVHVLSFGTRFAAIAWRRTFARRSG